MVDSFLKEMNKSVGDNFREVRDAMQATCEVQGQYTDAMAKALTDITSTLQQVGGVSTELQETMQQFESYVSSMRTLQEKLQESFDHYAEQIAENSKMAKNQQQHMEAMANAQKAISDNLEALVSDTESCLAKLQTESSRFVETAEQATTTIIQKSEEWTGKMTASLETTEQRMQQAENDISNTARNSLTSITQSVEAFGQTLANQAAEQAQGLVGLKEQISENLVESAIKLENVVSQLGIKVSDSLAKGFSEYDEELQTTIKSLNDTIRSVRTTTGNVPYVISDAQRELEAAIQQTEDHLSKLLNALDQMQQKTNARQAAFAEEEKQYEKAKKEFDESISEMKTQKEQFQQLVNAFQSRQDSVEAYVGVSNPEPIIEVNPKQEIQSSNAGNDNGEANNSQTGDETNPAESVGDFSLAGLDFSDMK